MTKARGVDKRVFFRLPLEMPVRFRLENATNEVWREGKTANLSSGGMLLQTARLEPEEKDRIVGDQVSVLVELALPGVSVPLRTLAQAMWAEDPDGPEDMTRIGFRFKDLGQTEQAWIHGLLEREAPGSSQPSPAK